jgi:hypothetical protein
MGTELYPFVRRSVVKHDSMGMVAILRTSLAERRVRAYSGAYISI